MASTPPLSFIFAGTGAFGVPVLQRLASDRRFKIPFVITGKDKPAGRGLQQTLSPIKKIAIANKLIVHQPESILELKQKLIQEKPDFLLVVSYGEIISKEILAIPRFGAINIHPSLLPRYRGASPVQEAILHGDHETGVTWILMNEKMDSGPVIAQEKIPIDPDEDSPALFEKLAKLAAEKTPEALGDFAKLCRSEPVFSMTQLKKQDESRVTYCKKIRKEDGFIDLHKETAEQILRKIRAYKPWPGCYLFLNSKRIKIIQARTGEQKISSGETKVIDGESLALGTAKGAFLPTIVQSESKREMRIEEFLRGAKI